MEIKERADQGRATVDSSRSCWENQVRASLSSFAVYGTFGHTHHDHPVWRMLQRDPGLLGPVILSYLCCRPLPTPSADLCLQCCSGRRTTAVRPVPARPSDPGRRTRRLHSTPPSAWFVRELAGTWPAVPTRPPGVFVCCTTDHLRHPDIPSSRTQNQGQPGRPAWGKYWLWHPPRRQPGPSVCQGSWMRPT